jgi:hypothetical protein
MSGQKDFRLVEGVPSKRTGAVPTSSRLCRHAAAPYPRTGEVLGKGRMAFLQLFPILPLGKIRPERFLTSIRRAGE